MTSIVQRLSKHGLINPPHWLADNVCYETQMGSVAYGCNIDESDVDVYGFCLPKKNMVFPHLGGEILGFGTQIQRFEQYQQHHISDKEAGKNYDLTIYSIVKYFQLCLDNNPNIIDSLFTPDFCVLHITEVGRMVRDSRNIFLHKGCWHRFRGYAYAQMHKIDIKDPNGKRKELIETYGFDTKFGYHIVRLILEVEQILAEGTLDLQRGREVYKAIRRGEWSLEELKKWFSDKETALEVLYHSSTLQYKPDEDAVKQLLLDCLEHYYGDLSKAVVIEGKADKILAQVKELVNGY